MILVNCLPRRMTGSAFAALDILLLKMRFRMGRGAARDLSPRGTSWIFKNGGKHDVLQSNRSTQGPRAHLLSCCSLLLFCCCCSLAALPILIRQVVCSSLCGEQPAAILVQIRRMSGCFGPKAFARPIRPGNKAVRSAFLHLRWHANPS